MSADLKIFTNTTNMNFMRVMIDDYEILNGDLLNVQIEQSVYKFGLTAIVEFKDTFDVLNNSKVNFNGDNTISISFRDYNGDSYYRTFKLMKKDHMQYSERFRRMTFYLIDELSYKLSNTYDDVYVNGDIGEFIINYINSNYSDIVESNKLQLSYSSNSFSNDKFLMNSNISMYSNIISKLMKCNLTLVQTRTNVAIKELNPSSLTVNSNKFTDKTMNSEYMFKIHDKEFIVNDINISPDLENYKIQNKNVISNTSNIDSIKSNMIINNNSKDDPFTNGSVKIVSNAALTDGERNYKLFKEYMNKNILLAVVPGTIDVGNIDTLINVELKGTVGLADIGLEGDVAHSGYYYVSGVTDKMIGYKFIQKLTLVRMDRIKIRELR